MAYLPTGQSEAERQAALEFTCKHRPEAAGCEFVLERRRRRQKLIALTVLAGVAAWHYGWLK